MISIIVPVYNAEKTLDMCLKSLVGQTYTDLQMDQQTDPTKFVVIGKRKIPGLW